MILGFAKHRAQNATRARRADYYRALTTYMDGPTVRKVIEGQPREVARDPVPEILAGSGSVLRRQIAALPFQRKYSFGMMSFAPEDVDVAAFNAGDPGARFKLGQALALLRETLWPGVPVAARPMLYVTTHTHVDRLEVNFALPRMVRNAAGQIRSYNPAPPGPRGYPPKLWITARDLLNQQLGWADPEDPYRAQRSKRPDWVLKLEAEALRAGLVPEADPRADLAGRVFDAIAFGELGTAQHIRTFLIAQLAPQGWAILSEDAAGITVGARGASSRERLRLKGPVFSPDFVASEQMDPARLAERHAERMAHLAQAPARFEEAWSSRAAYNFARYGGGHWPEPVWSLARWQDAVPAPISLPRKHHVQALLDQAQTGEPYEAQPHGPPILRLDGPDRDGAVRKLERPRGADEPDRGEPRTAFEGPEAAAGRPDLTRADRGPTDADLEPLREASPLRPGQPRATQDSPRSSGPAGRAPGADGGRLIDLVLAGRDALRLVGQDGQRGRLERIRAGVAVVLPETTLGLYPDHIRLLHGDNGPCVEMVLPSLCSRLGFVAPGAEMRDGRDILAGAEAYLARLAPGAEALPSARSPEHLTDDPDDAGPSF